MRWFLLTLCLFTNGLFAQEEEAFDAKALLEEAKQRLEATPEDEKAESEESAESDEDAEDAEEAEQPAPRLPTAEDDAELLDEDSSDPEIQLDLARAYISMGDKEAARVILEEVVNNGDEEQQAEARKMLEVLAT